MVEVAIIVPVIDPVSPVVTMVPVTFGRVQVRVAVRSAFVSVPSNELEPPAAAAMTMRSYAALAVSIVRPRIAAPPVKEDAVEVVAPRPVTEERVSVYDVRYVELSYEMVVPEIFTKPVPESASCLEVASPE